MSVKITDKQIEILINIIGAVETGGQIYGKQRYDDFTPAYTNSSAENSITIGAFQEFNWYAKALLQEILDTYPTIFRKYDNAGIESDLKKSTWDGYNPSKTSAKAKAIQAIIGSKEGIKIQNIRIERLLKQYIAFAEGQGVSNVDSLFMCANWIHQGGNSACTRLLKKAGKPYTLDRLYQACTTDTGNQVGAYKTRQKKVYDWIKQYISTSNSEEKNETGDAIMTTTKAINAVINVAKNEVGYLEKKSNSNLDSKTANAGSNNYTKYWRDIANWGLGNYQAQYWCAAFVFWCYVKAFGLETAKKLFYHAPYIYCPTAGSLFKQRGRLYSEPKVGDVVVFMSSGGVFGHTGIVYKVDSTYFYTIEGNTSSASGVVANGGAVEYKSYSISSAKNKGHKFCRPDYGIVTSVNSSTTTSSTNTSSTQNSNRTFNKTVKWTGVVTASELNVRTWVGASNPTCSFSPLKKNVEVGICDSEKDSNGVEWYYIKYNNKFGFVSSKYIKKKEVASSTSQTASTTTNKNKVESAKSFLASIAGTYKTTTDLNLRKGAGTNKGVQCVIPKGKKVTCYGYYTTVENVKWYLVTYNNYTGFVSSKYIKK